MHIDIRISPAISDEVLRRRIGEINDVLRERAERFAERYPEDAPRTMVARWDVSDRDARLISLRVTTPEGGPPMEDSFTADGLRNGIGRGEPDAAHWVFRIWDLFLQSQIERSLGRIREMLPALESD